MSATTIRRRAGASAAPAMQAARVGALVVSLVGLPLGPVGAEDALPTARECLEAAAAAADAWADDARLVWVENDAAVDASGRAAAWGFLYYSPEHGAMRSWSVRGGVITTGEDHAITAPAPALVEWVDSSAIAARVLGRGQQSCAACSLESLLLVQGVFAPGPTWVGVFGGNGGPRHYVVCDATSGEIVRDWRG
jgi:hypothetical protein